MKLLNFIFEFKKKKPVHFYSVLVVTLLFVSVAAFLTISHVRAAMTTIDSTLSATNNVHNGSSSTVVFTSDLVGYVFYVDADGTCVYNKTTDGGVTWGGSVAVDSQTDCIRVAVWYDQWTPGDTGSVIHVSTIDTSMSDIFYTALDTSTDTLTATINATGANQTNVFAVGANLQSITKGSDGDLYMGIQDNDDSYVIKCTSACTNPANWTEAGSNPFNLANHWLQLMPLANGDIMAIRWNMSGGNVQSKIYTDSTDTWDGAWTNIDTSAPVDTAYDAPFGATVDRSNGNIYLAYAAQTDVLGTDDDIRTAIYSAGTWTSKTDVVTDDAKGITGAKIAIDEGTRDIYVLYTGQTTPGTPASANIYYKKSTDGMTSWGAEQGPLSGSNRNFFGARMNLMSGERLYFTAYIASNDNLRGDTIADLTMPDISPVGARTFPSGISVGEPTAQGELGAETIQCVTSREVDIELEAQDAAQVILSNNKDFLGAEWENFTSPMTKPWVLEEGDGTKTVYILFRSALIAGNLSRIYTRTFELNSAGCPTE